MKSYRHIVKEGQADVTEVPKGIGSGVDRTGQHGIIFTFDDDTALIVPIMAESLLKCLERAVADLRESMTQSERN